MGTVILVVCVCVLVIVGGLLVIWRYSATGTALQKPAKRPLRRVMDVLVALPEDAWPGISDRLVHLRVWRGWCGWRPRTVVVLGVPGARRVPAMHLGRWAAWLTAHVIGRPGRAAVWITVRHRTRYEEPAYINEILRPSSSEGSGIWQLRQPVYLPGVTVIDDLIGSPLEQYPGEFYTPGVVRSYQETGVPVPVVDDTNQLHQLASALRVLEENRTRWPAGMGLACKVVAALLHNAREWDSGGLTGNPDSTWVSRAGKPDTDADHLAVIPSRATLSAADVSLLDTFASPVPDEGVRAALDVLMPLEICIRNEAAAMGDGALAAAVKIAVDELSRRASVAAEADGEQPGTLMVWRYKRWWIAARESMPWLTDPDDVPDPRYASNDIDWKSVARAVGDVAAQLDRPDLVSYFDNAVTVCCDLSGLGRVEEQIVRGWFGGSMPPTADPWFEQLVDGRHRLWNVWNAAPETRVPVRSVILCSAAESSIRANSVLDYPALLRTLPGFDQTCPTNQRFAANLDWAWAGNTFGNDYRGGPVAPDMP